ncbi:hypothetical protein [Pelagibius sp. 7325]|uniref:hypothetical protein n=1 Tax=Pelagibius sp. 7325 TaxID=3131994 RepID=UPI0030ED590F
MSESVLKAAVLAGVVMMAGFATPAAAASDVDARIKQAAQHFADLKDTQAKVILEELSAQGVAEADVLLGYLSSDPLYEERDYEAAVAAFEQAATAGDEEGIFQLAESRFWPDYSAWMLTPDEKAVRLSAEDAFGLLLRAVQDRPSAWGEAGARYWRLAWLCTLGGYDCGDELTDEAVRKGSQQIGNLRMIKGAFDILEISRSGESGTPEGEALLTAYFALGMAEADPYVAGIASELFWRDFTGPEDCPVPGSLAVAGRLLAMGWNAEDQRELPRDLGECFSAEELEGERAALVRSLDMQIRNYSNQDTWHLRSCYQNSHAVTFGDCLIHAVRDHYFACTKLSLIGYVRTRYKIDYTASARYKRCREAMIEARQG